MSKFAWVTLTTNDTYSLGALVLAHSLRRAGTAHQLAVLVTPGVSESMRNKLKDVYNVVQEVNVLDSQDAANLALLARPELGITFTKLHCWRLVQFEKCVFLDSDTLVLQNCDELFQREELSAAPDVSWPDCFNSGVFVFKPSLDTYGKITEFALKHGSFDGGDQGLLNSYFADWAHTDIQKHLPFVYNVTAYASYCYLPAFKQFRDKIKILHFAGKLKPWLIQFNSENKTACTPSDYAHAADLIQLWWNIFCESVHQKLTQEMNFWPKNISNRQDSQNYNTNYQPQDQIQERQYDQRSVYDFDFENIKDFHDPWEDYYENLNNEVNIETTPINEVFIMQEEHVEYQDHAAHIDSRVYEEPPKESEPQKDYCIDNAYNGENKSDIKTTEFETAKFVAETPKRAYSESTNTEAVILEPHKSQNETHTSTNVITETVQTKDLPIVVEAKETLDTQSLSANNENCIVNNEAGLAGALSQLRLGESSTPEQQAYEQLMRRQCWESGKIDYSGKDSFDNIWKKITQTLETKPSTEDDKSGSS